MGSAVDTSKETFGHAIGARVAVAHGIAYEIAVAVDESEVYTPCVDGYARHLESELSGLLESCLHVLEEGGEIPIYMIAKTHLAVLESVNELHGELFLTLFIGYGSSDDATGAAAEVNC